MTRVFNTSLACFLFLFSFFACSLSRAQCERDNTAFAAGEELNYDLYACWKFVWIKGGTARYKVRSANYAGQDALRTDLLFRGNKRADAVFVMKDTLISYMTPRLVPLYYRKGAVEGKHYTVDEVWYTYPSGRSHVEQKFLDRHGQWSKNHHETTQCNYDMLSMLNLARSFDATAYKVGRRIHFPMATGKKVEQQTLIYKGKKNFKANDDVTYRCLVFSLLDYDVKDKEKEMLRFYVTDDANHVPVRIDFYLRYGVARAYYVGGKGLRNPQTSIIKK